MPVEAFLQAASITYEQLLELLEVVWVRDGGATLNLQGLSDTCDLTIQSLAPAPLDPAVLDRAHRFLRMWRHAPWQMWELDQLLSSAAVAAGNLDGSGLLSLFTFRRLTEVTGLAVDQQLAFYGDLDTTPDGHRTPDGTRTPSLFSSTIPRSGHPSRPRPDRACLRRRDHLSQPQRSPARDPGRPTALGRRRDDAVHDPDHERLSSPSPTSVRSTASSRSPIPSAPH